MIFTKSSFPNRSGWITFFSHQYIPCYDMILTPKMGKFWGKFLDQGALFQFGTSIDGVDNCRHADSLAHICLSGSDHVRSRIQLGFPPFSFFGRPFWQQQVMQHVEGNDQGSREICRKVCILEIMFEAQTPLLCQLDNGIKVNDSFLSRFNHPGKENFNTRQVELKSAQVMTVFE